MPPVVRRLKRDLTLLWPAMLLLLVTACSERPTVPSVEHPSPAPQAAVTTMPALTSEGTASSGTGRADSAMRLPKHRDSEVEFARLSIEQGLSQSAVPCILQDGQGFMWFCTQDGLNRYDGYEFVVYKHDPETPGTLGNSFVQAIHEDPSGALWIATNGGGLSRLDRETGRLTHFLNDPSDPNSLSSNFVLSLFEDREGVLWIGTDGGGLNRLEYTAPGTVRFVRYQNDPDNPHSLSHDAVQSIYEDRAGALWIGTNGGGLDRFDREGGQFAHFQHDADDPLSLSNNAVQAIYEDREGVLWIGTNGGGLDRLDRSGASGVGAERFVHHQNDPNDPHSLSHNQVWSVFEDRLGVLWIGTFGGGLDRYDAETEQFAHFRNDPTDPHSLSSDQIWSIFEDDVGALWIGTFGGGVNRFDREKEKFTHFQADPDEANSLSENVVWSILEDEEGVLWIGTGGGGLNRFDRESAPGAGAGQFVHYQHVATDTQSLSDNVVWSIHEDVAGVLWVGTSAGLDRLDPESGRFAHYPGLPVFTIYEDGGGLLWIGTWGGGLGRFDRSTEELRFYQNEPTDPQSLSDDSVLSIAEDRQGVLWIGTFNGGLNRFERDLERFDHFVNDPDDVRSLSNNTVLSIHEDQEGVLWIATGGGGLNKLDRATETFTYYTEKDGLPNATVYGILEDDVAEEGLDLWLSTNNGLSRFNTRTQTFRNYDVGDGLQSSEFNQGAYHKSHSGEMFFGGVNGLNAFYPEQVRDNPHVPPIALTALTQGGEDVPAGAKIEDLTAVTFRWPRNFFEFEFAALDYAHPAENQYAFMLEGFDSDWIEAGTRRFGRYTNLPGGTYTLRMKGSNNDGVWSEEGTSLEVTVVPPFWRTWWFLGLVALVLFGGILGGYGLRVRSMEARSRELKAQVADRTKKLAALNAVTSVVSRSLDLQEILDDALGVTLRVTETEGGGVYLLDEKAGVLTIASYRGFGPDHAAEIDALRVGEGFSGHVAQSGQPLVVEDVSTDGRLTRFAAREEGFHSLACVPLSSKGKVLGTLFAVTRDFREFTDQDVELLTSISHQIGVALENARFFGDEQRRADQFHLISEVGRRITSILAVDELLPEVIKLIHEALGYDRVSIGLVEGDELVFRAAIGPGLGPAWDQHMRLRVGDEGVTGWVASTGEPLMIPDVNKEPRFVPVPVTPPSRSELAVPLKTKEAVIGVLNAESFRLNAFDEIDMVVLQSLAHQAAIAIENARLYEDASTRLAQLTALQETTSAVASTLDLDKLLNLIIQQATTLLNADGGVVNLVNWERREDEVVAASGLAAPFLGQPSRLDGSLSGWVALHNEAVISNRLRADDRVYQPALSWPEVGEIHSAALAPLTVKDQVVGTLVVMGTKEGKKEFGPPDLDLLVAFANQAATAIENAQLLEGERQRADELDALRTTLADITAELELSSLLQAILERAAALLDATGGELGLYDEASRELRIAVSHNLGEDYAGTRHALGEGAMGRVAETGESLIIEDYQTWEGALTEYGHVHATLATPLKVGGRLVGVFTTVTTDPERRFTSADLRQLNLFAQQAAIAIENARLYEQAQQLAVVEERQRLARDLHDSVTQALYGMTLYSEAAAEELSLSNLDVVAEYLRELQDTAKEGLAEMRLLIYELRPTLLAEEGLVAALQARLLAVEGRAGLKTQFKVEAEDRLSPDVEEGLYRIAQEALNNALKHAQANTITIRLRHSPQERKVTLDVMDDGIGFDAAVAREEGGLGLIAMEERAAELGGQLSVGSGSRGGTRVHVEVPT